MSIIERGDPPELAPLTATEIPREWFAAAGGCTRWDAEDAAGVLVSHIRHHPNAEVTHA